MDLDKLDPPMRSAVEAQITFFGQVRIASKNLDGRRPDTVGPHTDHSVGRRRRLCSRGRTPAADHAALASDRRRISSRGPTV